MDNQFSNKILAAAIMAPSGDNVQPWHLVTDNSQINLFNLPDKDTSYFNYKQVACYIAHGAVLENISIAARQLGAKAEISLFPDRENADHVARIEFSSIEPTPEPLYPAIFSRHTNRFHFRRKILSDSDANKIMQTVESIDKAALYLVTEQNKIKQLANVLKTNDRIIFERKDLHGFLFDQIRWVKSTDTEPQDGMPISTLGLNPLEKLLFPLFRFWRIVKVFNYFGLSRTVGLKAWWNCRSASALGMITVDTDDRQSIIQGGRAIQRVWLEAERQGLAFQPVAGLPLLAYRLINNAGEELSAGHRKWVANAQEKLPALFGFGDKAVMLMGFRLGLAERPVQKTGRRPVDRQ